MYLYFKRHTKRPGKSESHIDTQSICSATDHSKHRLEYGKWCPWSGVYVFHQLGGLLQFKNMDRSFDTIGLVHRSRLGTDDDTFFVLEKNEEVTLNTFISAFGNNTASLLAGMAILPAVFALAPSSEGAVAYLQTGNQALTLQLFLSCSPLFKEGVFSH